MNSESQGIHCMSSINNFALKIPRVQIHRVADPDPVFEQDQIRPRFLSKTGSGSGFSNDQFKICCQCLLTKMIEQAYIIAYFDFFSSHLMREKKLGTVV